MSLSPRRALFVWLCMMLAASLPAQAQEKIRIAVWDVENHAATSWAFWNDMGPAARNHIDTEFSENPTLAAKFAVVERTQLALVMKEQGLAASGAVTPQTAAKVGSLLGVKYIVIGGIDKFAINDTKAGFRGVGGNLQQAEAAINLRFIDTTTGERVLAVSGEAEVRKGGGFFRGASASRDAQWGIASEAIEKASKTMLGKFVTGGYLDRLASVARPGALEARVVKIDGQKIWINAGAQAGLKVGDTFGVFNVGEALIDPVTGASLGADEKQTGSAAVIEVQDKYAIVALTGTATAKDVLRKAP
jgi:curli biogenesis system outer membrane secretion channel CsgG